MKEPRKKKLYVVMDVLCVIIGKFGATSQQDASVF